MTTYSMKPLGCDPQHVKGMSERLIVSHYENNYGGAVKRLNLITEQLAGLDFNTAPGLPDQRAEARGTDRRQLDDPARVVLRWPGRGERAGQGLCRALTRDFGSVERWRSEFIAMGKALGGGSGWVLLSWSPRDGRLMNQWAAGPLPHARGRPADPGARYVRALLSHRLRRQGGGLCRHLHGGDPLEQRRQVTQRAGRGLSQNGLAQQGVGS